jgi:hypothetical protein
MKTPYILGFGLLGSIVAVACGDDANLGTAMNGTGGSANTGGSSGDASADACVVTCGGACCSNGETCVSVGGAEQCRVDLGPCTSHADCSNDSYCDPGLSHCIGYLPGESDEACKLKREPGVFRVSLQCEWKAPPTGDPAPTATDVYVMPLVADFGFGGADTRPSIVFVTAVGSSTALRIIDGSTCAHQITLVDPAPYSDATPAIGDLNGDGRPEIVIRTNGGGIAAIEVDPVAKTATPLWHTTTPGVTGVQSLSLADLDDDGKPEIVVGSRVYAADGTYLDAVPTGDEHLCGPGGSYVGPTVVADVDHDGRLELVYTQGIWELNGATKKLSQEAYFTPNGGVGFVAVGDFGDFPAASGDGAGKPEIVVMSFGQLRMQSIGGDLVFGPKTLPGSGDGGNVTIADYDGDGAPEIGVVGYYKYVVFDPRCGDDTRPGSCVSNRTDGILWEQDILENSCAIMGSTVFDFEGDGAAEVVYADQCYLRIMSGVDGRVLWSHPRSSGTWYEAPIVADVDGDFIAELVTPAAWDVPGCASVDPVFAGLTCSDKAACLSPALTCDQGLCRCSVDADCGDPDMVCTAPLAGSPGSGNVCRSKYQITTGIRVYSDEAWVPSRTIWNQHAYSITNVNTDGTVPKGSATARNWTTPGLNNFRQNVQDGLGEDPALDLTVKGTSYGQDCSKDNPVLPLEAEVCNRGTLPLGKAITVTFLDGTDVVCTALAQPPLAPGACTKVTCDWNDPPIGKEATLEIVVDSGDEALECQEENNRGTLDVRCPPPRAVPQ